LRLTTFSVSAVNGSGRTAAALAGIALLAVLARIPFNNNAGVDEAFYLVVGRQWLNGVPPYSGAFDVKPPLLFLLVAGAEALFGASLAACKALASGAAALTACGLYLYGRRFLGELAGSAAAILYISSTLTVGGTFFSAELLMAPFTTFGVLIGLAALFGRGSGPFPGLLASGLLLGAAACIKQTAIFDAAPLALWLALYSRREERLRALTLFTAGICAVPAAFALYYLAIGHLADMVNAVCLAALARAGVGYVPWSKAFMLLLTGMLALIPLIAMAGGFWAERRPLRTHPTYPSMQFLMAWAACALAGVFVTKAMFVIYILPLLQPLCLAAGGFLQHVLGRIHSRGLRLGLQTTAIATAVFYSWWAVSSLIWAGEGSVKAAEAAAALMAREGKRAEDRVLVVDRDLLVYVAAGAEPAFPIFHPQQLLCGFPAQGAASALSDTMKTSPAFVLVADPPLIRVCEVPERREGIEARLSLDYCELGRFESTVTGWPGDFVLFGLKKRIRSVAIETCGKRAAFSSLKPVRP
jgi:4-amino-4-deoxy-L-arabinose transferase-like glycosyltransferase